jgi:hypothetical protein
MRPETDGWRQMCEVGRWWSIGLAIGLAVVLVLVLWPDVVSLARCLFRGACG